MYTLNSKMCLITRVTVVEVTTQTGTTPHETEEYVEMSSKSLHTFIIEGIMDLWRRKRRGRMGKRRWKRRRKRKEEEEEGGGGEGGQGGGGIHTSVFISAACLFAVNQTHLLECFQIHFQV